MQLKATAKMQHAKWIARLKDLVYKWFLAGVSAMEFILLYVPSVSIGLPPACCSSDPATLVKPSLTPVNDAVSGMNNLSTKAGA